MSWYNRKGINKMQQMILWIRKLNKLKIEDDDKAWNSISDLLEMDSNTIGVLVMYNF